MTTAELTPARPAGHASRLLALAEGAVSRVAALVVAIRNRRAINRLLEMDERMLTDIGLTRGDVYSSLSGPIETDPSVRLTSLWSERRHAAHQSARQRLRPPAQWMKF
jgi:uncharacterized protein YjiS (DUF1127 family)